MLNWLAYNYRETNGYGRYSNRLIWALRGAGVAVRPELTEAAQYPDWLQKEKGLAWDGLTISCMPPFYLRPLREHATGQHWLLTMTEGGALPKDWAEMIRAAHIDRVLVPCEHNARVFREGGIACPVTVIPGGTDPDEFPLISERRPNRPYTFLALADRGERKGWYETYAAFFKAFGTVQETGPEEVRLIVKCTVGGNELIEMLLEHGSTLDPRITFLMEDIANIADLYRQVDCFAIPSRTEGWGMPHREAAMMGLPVITQAHSGLDDGHTRDWAIVVEKGQMQPITGQGHMAGEWRVADIGELADKMRACYEQPEQYRARGYHARRWLESHQTWADSAAHLMAVMREHGVMESRIVSYTSEEVKKLPSESDWAAADAMTDEEIRAAIASDPDEARRVPA